MTRRRCLESPAEYPAALQPQTWAPLGGRQRTKRSTVTLPAPVRQRRRVQTFPPQDRSDPTNAGRAVRLGQNTQLRLRCKSPTSRPIRHLGRRRRRGRHDGGRAVPAYYLPWRGGLPHKVAIKGGCRGWRSPVHQLGTGRPLSPNTGSGDPADDRTKCRELRVNLPAVAP